MGVKRIDPDRAFELLADPAFTYLDVRTATEFEGRHIPSAQNVPVMVRGEGGFGLQMNDQFVDDVRAKFKKNAKVILGCRKGGRSAKAADLLSAAGFTNLYEMRGGLIGETDPFGKVTYPGWSARGLPVTSND